MMRLGMPLKWHGVWSSVTCPGTKFCKECLDFISRNFNAERPTMQILYKPNNAFGDVHQRLFWREAEKLDIVEYNTLTRLNDVPAFMFKMGMVSCYGDFGYDDVRIPRRGTVFGVHSQDIVQAGRNVLGFRYLGRSGLCAKFNEEIWNFAFFMHEGRMYVQVWLSNTLSRIFEVSGDGLGMKDVKSGEVVRLVPFNSILFG